MCVCVCVCVYVCMCVCDMVSTAFIPFCQPVVLKGWIQGLDLCVSQLSAEDDVLVGATLVCDGEEYLNGSPGM